MKRVFQRECDFLRIFRAEWAVFSHRISRFSLPVWVFFEEKERAYLRIEKMYGVRIWSTRYIALSPRWFHGSLFLLYNTSWKNGHSRSVRHVHSSQPRVRIHAWAYDSSNSGCVDTRIRVVPSSRSHSDAIRSIRSIEWFRSMHHTVVYRWEKRFPSLSGRVMTRVNRHSCE